MMRFTKPAQNLNFLCLPSFLLFAFDLPDISLPDVSLPNLNLPNLSLSDSLSSLAAMANQLQAIVNLAITHPIWAIAIVILAITLIQIIADLIKRFVKAALTFVLKLPLMLSHWIWQRATSPSPPAHTDQIHTNQIQQLISRLESLRAEQDQVMAQLKSLLSETPLSKAPLSEKSQSQQLSEAPDQPAATEERKSSATVSPDVG